MRQPIQWAANRMPASEDRQLSIMSTQQVAMARSFHRSFPQYSVTPLARLDKMAAQLGLGGVYVKDESYRFGLNAFKVLGGSFAMGRYIAQQMGRDISQMTYEYLTSAAFRQEFGQATFFTATDGNHGRGVAWAAARLGKKLTQNKNRAKAPKKKMAAFSAQMRRRCARSSILGQLLSFLCPCYSTLPGKMQVKKL